MRYKIKDIPADGLRVQQALGRTLLSDAFTGLEVDLEQTRADVRLELHKSDENVFLRGTLSGAVTLPCASCLGPARVPLDARLRFTFVPDDDEAVGDDDDPLDDEEFGHHDRETVDLGPILREQLILALPISARCREGCAGLCPTCGQNRNEADCGHRAGAGLSALGAQLEKLRDTFPKS